MERTDSSRDEKQGRRRLLIVGLDGATMDVIGPLARAGRLPCLDGMIKHGVSGELLATLPPITAPSWSSFYTASNPGKHGIFDMRHRLPDTYKFAPVNTSFLRRDPFWIPLSRQGLKVGVFNIPLGYPPQPIANGLVAAGLLSPPQGTGLVWPPEFEEELRRTVPSYTPWLPQLALGQDNEANYLRSAAQLIDHQFDAMEFAMDWLDDWHLFFCMVQFPDQLFHWFWKNDDPDHPDHHQVPELLKGAVAECHVHLDERLARLRKKAGSDAVTMVLSDHGNGPLHREIFMDSLLAHRGWIKFKRNPLTLGKRFLARLGLNPRSGFQAGHKLGLGPLIRRSLRFRRRTVESALARVFLSQHDVDWSRSVAYAYGTWGSIFINLRDREPEGCVSPNEYELVRAQIIEDLAGLRDPESGEALFAEVLSRDELYDGTELDYAPDILVIPADDKVHPNALVPFASTKWIGKPISSESGWHRRQGMFAIEGPGVRKGLELRGKRIEDAGATVFALMAGALPPDVDGRPLSEAFEHDLDLFADPITTAQPAQQEVQPYAPDEIALIDRRLSDLGY